MFPLQRGNEMVIQFSSPHQHNKISQDLINNNVIVNDTYHHPHHSLDNNNDIISFSADDINNLQGSNTPHSTCSFTSGRHNKKKLLFDSSSHGVSKENNNNKKKLVHREIERQRRQEMANLHASLRSLLPLEFIKGKRSISDHMNEAVNYIKHLEKNIKGLSSKRDELKKLLKISSSNPEETHDANDDDDDDKDDKDDDDYEYEKQEYKYPISYFSVHKINNDDGVGIEVSCGLRDKKKLPLSKLLEILHEEEGLGVVACVSTHVNGRLIQSVQCEVANSDHHVDLPALRRKISNLVPSFRCSD